jgi:hypothetical protein
MSYFVCLFGLNACKQEARRASIASGSVSHLILPNRNDTYNESLTIRVYWVTGGWAARVKPQSQGETSNGSQSCYHR